MTQSNGNAKLPPPPGAPVQGLARDAFGREIPETQPAITQEPTAPAKKEKATDALGRRAGALADELDFPAFVASLIHGTFDAIVDSSIRQMESFADLVSAVAKPLDQFSQENVTLNQARDWLVEQYPQDVTLAQSDGGLVLAPVPQGDPDDFVEPPSWLAEFDEDGADLSSEFLESSLLPKARERLAQQRLSNLATMVLLGMNRVVVNDGNVGARLRFRAAAADHAAVEYASSDDPQSGGTVWGGKGAGSGAVTKVSTVGVNVQSDSQLKAELFGEVKINFATEAVPLDRFVDEAQRTLLERNSRNIQRQQAQAVQQPQQAAPPAGVIPPPTTGNTGGNT